MVYLKREPTLYELLHPELAEESKPKLKSEERYIAGDVSPEAKKLENSLTLGDRLGRVGNPYEHRYKNKREEVLTQKEFEHYYYRAVMLEKARLEQKERAKYPYDFRIQIVSISGLLAMLYYTGLRITEIVGDKPHKYRLKDGTEKWTKELHGLRSSDLSIMFNKLKVDVKEVRKHGKREEPIWIPLDRLGVDSIVAVWKETELRKRIFPITKWLGWRLIADVTEGTLYPHFFRLNRATEFANNPETSILELKKWFAWARLSTASFYMGRAGRTTKKMAERL